MAQYIVKYIATQLTQFEKAESFLTISLTSPLFIVHREGGLPSIVSPISSAENPNFVIFAILGP